MSSDTEKFVEISGVFVNPEIFSRRYTCDPDQYGCTSMCCYRSCIVPEEEAHRVEQHLDDILSFLPTENSEAIRGNGSILGDCAKQCPTGCVIHDDEARAIRRGFGGKPFRCVLLFKNNCALLYTTPEGNRYCGVHSYALAKGMVWEEFKFADCVQYPLSFYTDEQGHRILTIQNTPYLSHIRCMTEPSGALMYKSLRKTIEIFMGREFYQALEAYAQAHPADAGGAA